MSLLVSWLPHPLLHSAGFVFLSAAFIGLSAYLAYRSWYARQLSGMESHIGKEALVIEDFGPRGGRVRFEGEDWAAQLSDSRLDAPIGSEVVIEAIKGLTLIVKPKS